jgi:hypothetical protein
LRGWIDYGWGFGRKRQVDFDEEGQMPGVWDHKTAQTINDELENLLDADGISVEWVGKEAG